MHGRPFLAMAPAGRLRFRDLSDSAVTSSYQESNLTIGAVGRGKRQSRESSCVCPKKFMSLPRYAPIHALALPFALNCSNLALT
jgi:hypothetical protein